MSPPDHPVTGKEDTVELDQMIRRMKGHPDYPQMGMIASHLGVVRGRSLKGKQVKSVHVSFDSEAINRIISDVKSMDGIVEVLVDIFPGRLEVGREIMAVVVGGDTREHVFPALIEAVDRIKREATQKREEYGSLGEDTGGEG